LIDCPFNQKEQRTNAFGFNFLAGSNAVIVVEVATNLASPVWVPVGTNTLTNGSAFFSDPGWTKASRPLLPPPLAVGPVGTRSTALVSS